MQCIHRHFPVDMLINKAASGTHIMLQTYLTGRVARKNIGPATFVKGLALTSEHL